MIRLKYGLPTDKEGVQLRLGVERGFFRDEGIDFDIEVVFGGPEITSRYASGTLGVGELGTPPAITAIGKGAAFKLVGSGVRRRALQYLVGSPQISDWNDLKGATAAAFSIGSCIYWFMRLVLQSHGLDPDHGVKVVGLGPRYPKVLDLFEAGELQAAVISEPNVSIGESQGLFRIMQALTDEAYRPPAHGLRNRHGGAGAGHRAAAAARRVDGSDGRAGHRRHALRARDRDGLRVGEDVRRDAIRRGHRDFRVRRSWARSVT